MVLAFFLLQVKDEMGLKIGCFHLDHMYRGREAEEDALFVRNFCEEKGLVHHILRRNVPEIAKAEKIGFELCARKIRLSLAEELRRKDYDYILTAHHLDDSIESIVHNFIRGASLQGLSGMDFINGHFVRPFLDFGKNEILEIAAEKKIFYREDASNLDTEFTRNLIRHAIVPEILKINPNFRETIKRASKQYREDGDYLERESKKFLEKIKIPKSALKFPYLDIISLDLPAFRRLDVAIKKRILRLLIQELKGNLTDVYSSVIEEILLLSERTQSGKHLLFQGIRFELSRERLLVSRVKQADLESLPLELGARRIGNMELRVSRLPYERAKERYFAEQMREDCFILPEADLREGLSWRRRKSGDYIRPKRLKGKRKSVKKLLIDRKLAGSEKDALLLLARGEEVWWIVDLEKKSMEDSLENHKNENFILIELFSL